MESRPARAYTGVLRAFGLVLVVLFSPMAFLAAAMDAALRIEFGVLGTFLLVIGVAFLRGKAITDEQISRWKRK